MMHAIAEMCIPESLGTILPSAATDAAVTTFSDVRRYLDWFPTRARAKLPDGCLPAADHVTIRWLAIPIDT